MDKGPAVSKERQQRRAEREAAAAAAAAQRAAEARSGPAAGARTEKLTGWLPRPGGPARPGCWPRSGDGRPAGPSRCWSPLNLLVFAFTRDWYVTGLTLVASLLGAPIVHMMLFRKG